MLPSAEEITKMRPLARAKIQAGHLPSTTDVGWETNTGTSGHRDCCRVCEAIIGPDEPFWYRLDFYSKTLLDPHQRGPIKPELHTACYSAWRVEVEARLRVPVKLTLVKAPADESVASSSFQDTLSDFNQLLRSAGLEYQQTTAVFDSFESQCHQLPEYVITLATVAIPTIGHVLAAWIKSRPGRATCLKFGGVEVRARDAKQVREVLTALGEFLDTERKPPTS